MKRRSASSPLVPAAVAALAAALVLAACSGGGSIVITTTTPTPTSEATAEPTATATATPVGVPPRPERPFSAGRDVQDYLAGGDADIERCLPELVEEWGLARDIEGPRCVAADFDGDGEDELAFLISYDDAEPATSDIWFFEDEEDDWRFYNSARGAANSFAPGLEIRAVEDLTGDGKPELIATWQECGASTCVSQLLIASHHDGVELENLAPSGAQLAGLDEFEIADRAVRMRGGTEASVGAGPQRTSTMIVSWAGVRFRVETEQGEPEYLVHLLNDADLAYVAAEFDEARELYLQASQDTTLADWKQEIGEAPDRPELQAYAFFRAALVALEQGDQGDWIALMTRAGTEYADTMHGQAARVYLQSVGSGDPSPQVACTAAEDYLAEYEELYQRFWDFGTANPTRSIFTLCR